MKPIIQTMLDIDFYKFTMGQLVFENYPDVAVCYTFKNRTLAINIADFIDESSLREQLDEARNLRFSNSALHYLRGTNEYSERMFAEPYLEFLRNFRLPSYNLEKVNGAYQLEFAGKWSETIYWETIALAIINELYYKWLLSKMSRFEREVIFAEGKLRLAGKIKLLRKYPDIRISDFSTRRRFSRDQQWHVIETLAEEIPNQLLGTSNVEAANHFGLLPMGTSAHEMYMAMSGIMHKDDANIRASHNQVLKEWWKRYGWGLSIALADTYGSNFFFQDFSPQQAKDWKGLRHDSGDPLAFGEAAIRFYKYLGIDPRDKMIVFSDGLDVASIVDIFRRFNGRIKTTFGWGTNLSNDLGLKPLSLVVKVTSANGNGVVKLSDNLAKAIGTPEDIERFKRIFGYTGSNYEPCIY